MRESGGAVHTGDDAALKDNFLRWVVGRGGVGTTHARR